MEGTIESLHSRTESSTNSARLLVKSRLGRAGVEMDQQDSYTIATPLTTTNTEVMTPLVNSLPSQNFSTRHTKGMMRSLAICILQSDDVCWKNRGESQFGHKGAPDKD